ncbi:uncharacterized protein LOC108154054 [Drosophila miranda]|uniref:uncharacterized protein LOC108154054 n=1 Tax=Drosophila miranda TaxID=7229 RepID=UPI0007E64845|nr:uncharacterized protein LOC108154054 [Drosophila miranda]
MAARSGIPFPKYLTVSRLNSRIGLQRVMVEHIWNALENICCGPVDFCQKLSNGKVLVKTWAANLSSAKLPQVCFLPNNIDVEVKEHHSLNHGRAVMHSYDLAKHSEAEILQQLQEHNVISVRKITRWRQQPSKKHETGLIILHFDTYPPPSIQLNGKIIRLHPYVPTPTRCMNCLLFGHPTRACQRPSACLNCGYAQHLNFGEKCSRNQACVNCRTRKVPHSRHHTLDRTCPTFIWEDQIKAISIISRVSRRRAISIYNSRLPRDMSHFSEGARLSYLKAPHRVTMFN